MTYLLLQFDATPPPISDLVGAALAPFTALFLLWLLWRFMTRARRRARRNARAHLRYVQARRREG